MKKRFIVMVDVPTEPENRVFHTYLKSCGVGWWHWLSRAWLIVASDPDLTAGSLRSEARKIFHDSHLLVIELDNDGDTWAGFGPKQGKKNMFTWLKANWKKGQ